MASKAVASFRGSIRVAGKLGRGFGGYPAPDDDSPPGWGGPVMNQAIVLRAIDKLKAQLKPQPDPWFGGGIAVAGKPQPIPWRGAFAVAFAHAAIEHALALQGLAETLPGEVGKGFARGAVQYLGAFVDDYCGTRPKKIPIPIGPRPFELALDHSDLMLIAGQLGIAAGMVPGDLARSLSDAAETFAAAAQA